MQQFTGQVQELNRVAIPKTVREIEGIKPGDYVTIQITKVEKA